MFNRNESSELLTNQLDPDHDLDLVALFNSARTDRELRDVMQMTRNRMRSRRAAGVGARQRRGFAGARLMRLTQGRIRRG